MHQIPSLGVKPPSRVEVRIGQSQVDTPLEEPGVGVVLEQVDHPALGSVESRDMGGDHSKVSHLKQIVGLVGEMLRTF